MRKLCDHLQRKKIKNLAIEIKEPENYDFRDVLAIAVKLNEQHRDSNTGACMRRIAAFARVTAQHKSTILDIISLAPTDVYGSLISGALTLIIGVSISVQDSK